MSKSATIRCWICNDAANSGEHKIKASDLKAVFGHFDQNSPLFLSTDQQRNLKIKGPKSKLLKHQALLCAKCNNQLSQPYDLAWQKLSNYLRTKTPKITNGSIIKLDKIFPGSTKKSMLDVHLFFLKLFGCLIVEHSIPIDISIFSNSLKNGEAHPKVYISFSTDIIEKSRKTIGTTPIQADLLNGKVIYAAWYYILDKFDVNIIYAEPTEYRKGLINTWHPFSISKKLKIL